MASGTGACGIGGVGAGNAASVAGSVSDVSDAVGFANGGRTSVSIGCVSSASGVTPDAVGAASVVPKTNSSIALPMDLRF